jgi:hypothetical protein
MLKRSIARLQGSVNVARLRGCGALAAAFTALLLVGLHNPAAAQAPRPRFERQAQRVVSLDAVLLETIRIEGQIQGWTMGKLCIDGQAYWVGFSETNPTGISPAFRDGKPEQCPSR